MSLQSDSCANSSGESWQLRDVAWRRVLTRQDFGSIAASLVAIVALAIAQAAMGGPTSRPFMITDATVSFPHGESSVPYWLACLVSALMALLSIMAGEVLLGRRRLAGLTDALAATLHFFIDAIAAFIVTGLGTTVMKVAVGRLRPDFLDRCKPAVPFPLTVEYGLSAAANPACTAPPSGELTDGHYSFPSGHTSTVFVFAFWSTAYCVWAFNLRQPRRTVADLAVCSLRERLRHELCTACGFLWILGMQAFAWYVGVSRITDFKHHPSDVIAGAFLGTTLGLLFAARSIANVGQVAAVLAKPACGSGTPGDATPEPTHLLLHNSRVHNQGAAAV